MQKSYDEDDSDNYSTSTGDTMSNSEYERLQAEQMQDAKDKGMCDVIISPVTFSPFYLYALINPFSTSGVTSVAKL